MANLYQVLELPASCSHAELKRSYQRLAREHHPDKSGDASIFHRVDRAWKVLGNADSRRKYDAELKASEIQSRPPVQEEIRLSQALYDPESRCYLKECRCGGRYVLCESEVCEDLLLLVDCDDCSLSILVDCEGGHRNKDDPS